MKGICFIEPLFHRVVKGEKTQTRRMITPQPVDSVENLMFCGNIVFRTRDEYDELIFINPKYEVGEKVYLKEPYILYQEEYQESKTSQSGIQYAYKFGNHLSIEEITGKSDSKWKNKLFMPESAARHSIEITGVRAERLQDISEEDCFKEGIEEVIWKGKILKSSKYYFNGYESYDTPIEAYAELIDRINGNGIWERNPWVWVYDFKLVK